MKNTILFAVLFVFALPAMAQRIENNYNIDAQAKIIDNNKAIKLYKDSFELHDEANNLKSYFYEYVADLLTGNLIKAVIKDDRYNITGTFYFANERLIKLYQKKIDQNGRTSTMTS